MSCAKRCLLFVFVLFILVSCTAAAGLYSAARWLHHADAPQNSDAIVLLAGDLTRALEAAQLYREGYAPRVYISVAARGPSSRLFEDVGITVPSAEELIRQVLLRKGVPDGSIAWLAKDMLSTATEAQATKALVERGERRLLVVTSPYHTRRTGIVFHRAIPNADIRIIASRYETFPEDWWHEQHASISVILEVAKLTFYFLGGRF